MSDFIVELTPIGPEMQPFLSVLGIVVDEARGVAKTDTSEDGRTWRDIGSIVFNRSTGIIKIRPRHGISDHDMSILRGHACDAFIRGPKTKTGWLRRRKPTGTTWTTTVCVLVE